jgi:NADPH:quinone reductase-like Zn-dependent oxidoreductase
VRWGQFPKVQEVLRVEEVPTPEPADGEVLIRVRAASVNPIDWKYRRGLAPSC